VECIRPAH
ncbi:putative host specificity protein, partial [Escherichia coli EC1865]